MKQFTSVFYSWMRTHPAEMATVAQMEATQSQSFLESMGEAGQAALWVGNVGWVTTPGRDGVLLRDVLGKMHHWKGSKIEGISPRGRALRGPKVAHFQFMSVQ